VVLGIFATTYQWFGIFPNDVPLAIHLFSPPHSGANEEQRPSAAASRALCKHPGDCRVRRQTSIPIPLFRL